MGSLPPLQARQEAEDAALLVDYTGSIARSKCPLSRQSKPQQPSPLHPPHLQHPQSAHKHHSTRVHTPGPLLQPPQSDPRQQIRKGGHRQSWADPSRFSMDPVAGKASFPQLATAMQLDTEQPACEAVVPGKHSDRQQTSQMLRFDIDDGDDLASMPSKHCARVQSGTMLKFNIDDDDDEGDDPVPMLVSSRQHAAPVLKFDIDDDHGDDDAAPMLDFDIDDGGGDSETAPVPLVGRQHGTAPPIPLLDRQHERQGSRALLKSDLHDCHDVNDVNEGHGVHDGHVNDGHDVNGHDVNHDYDENGGNDVNDGNDIYADDDHADPRHDSCHHDRKQKVCSAPVMGFDISDSEDETGAENSAANQMDERLDAGRGEVSKPSSAYIYMAQLVHSSMYILLDIANWN